jgi:hypothetical protein
MKTINWLLALLTTASLVLVACGKPAAKAHDSLDVNGVEVELPKFHQAFAAPTPEQQPSVSQVIMSIRYRQCDQALEALDQLAKDPSLTEPQTRVVAALREQVQRLAAKLPLPPAPAP